MPTRDAVIRLSQAMGLSDMERDHLLATAGFMPLRLENLIAAEPVVGEVLGLLQNGAVPDDVREDLRTAIRSALRQAQRATSSWSGGAMAPPTIAAD
jgi:hypothetical protein